MNENTTKEYHKNKDVSNASKTRLAEHFLNQTIPDHWTVAHSDTFTDQNDMINQPYHYTSGMFEVIDVIDDVAKHAGYSPEEMFAVGNVLKYVMRAPNKGYVEDLKKARWYLDRVIETAEQNVVGNEK